jgi:hypothetical protein
VAWFNNSTGVRAQTIVRGLTVGTIGPTIKLDSRNAQAETGSTITTEFLTVAPGDTLTVGVFHSRGSNLDLSGAANFGNPVTLQCEWYP